MTTNDLQNILTELELDHCEQVETDHSIEIIVPRNSDTSPSMKFVLDKSTQCCKIQNSLLPNFDYEFETISHAVYVWLDWLHHGDLHRAMEEVIGVRYEL